MGRCFPEDRFGDFDSVAQDIGVPESEDAIAVAIEIRRSLLVTDCDIGLTVLGAINLHCYLGAKAGKIHYVTSDRMLTTKMQTEWFHATQPRPEQTLRQGCFPSQLPCALIRHGLCHRNNHLYRSPPRRGGRK